MKAGQVGRGTLGNRRIETVHGQGRVITEALAEPPDEVAHCVYCGKQYHNGPYGSWRKGGTCSKLCEGGQTERERFLSPSGELLISQEEVDETVSYLTVIPNVL